MTPSNEMPLKPCPFCGSGDVRYGTEKYKTISGRTCDKHQIFCGKCLSCCDSIDSKDAAVKIWNTRATTDKVMIDRAELERVRDGLKFITNGCLVPPDGGSPIWPDDAIEAATKALQILEAAMKGEK